MVYPCSERRADLNPCCILKTFRNFWVVFHLEQGRRQTAFCHCKDLQQLKENILFCFKMDPYALKNLQGYSEIDLLVPEEQIGCFVEIKEMLFKLNYDLCASHLGTSGCVFLVLSRNSIHAGEVFSE